MDGWVSRSELILRLLLDFAPDNSEVRLDISDVVQRGFVEAKPDLCSTAFEHFYGHATAFSPLIVLTEGVTDAEFLSQTVDVLAPHLNGYIRFLDYDFKPEGSASALVRAVRAFAAAGISNRIVALFDNDAAAAEALMTLDKKRLPPNFRVCQLPHLPLAVNYPTLGPNGLSCMDINGLAVSVEMFFGEDILRIVGNDLSPVQWRGYMSKIGRYQSELMNKARLQAEFRTRAQEALKRGEMPPSEDWSGMKLLLRELTSAFT